MSTLLHDDSTFSSLVARAEMELFQKALISSKVYSPVSFPLLQETLWLLLVNVQFSGRV